MIIGEKHRHEYVTPKVQVMASIPKGHGCYEVVCPPPDKYPQTSYSSWF